MVTRLKLLSPLDVGTWTTSSLNDGAIWMQTSWQAVPYMSALSVGALPNGQSECLTLLDVDSQDSLKTSACFGLTHSQTHLPQEGIHIELVTEGGTAACQLHESTHDNPAGSIPR